MNIRGIRKVVAAAGLVAAAVTVVACGNQTPPSTGATTPAPSAPGTPSAPEATATPVPTEGTAAPVRPTPTKSTPTSPVAQRLTSSMLLTGQQVAKADRDPEWAAHDRVARSICGKSATQGDAVQGRLTRAFDNGLDASGGQWLTRYSSPAAATAAYERIVATIKSCKEFKPAATNAHKLTENRTLAAGDATAILRWYDYPLPSDPGSEDSGFPYAVTRKGSIVSVLAFGEMGKGIAPAHWEAIARAAAAKLP